MLGIANEQPKNLQIHRPIIDGQSMLIFQVKVMDMVSLDISEEIHLDNVYVKKVSNICFYGWELATKNGC